jgi:transposase-like protein
MVMVTEILEGSNNGVGGRRKRKKLTAQEKWQIFLETSVQGAPVGEILRRYGLYSSELTKIRKQVESGALKELGRKKYSKKPQQVPYEEYEKLKTELTAKEKALAQMGEEYLLLKKRTD